MHRAKMRIFAEIYIKKSEKVSWR